VTTASNTPTTRTLDRLTATTGSPVAGTGKKSPPAKPKPAAPKERPKPKYRFPIETCYSGVNTRFGDLPGTGRLIGYPYIYVASSSGLKSNVRKCGTKCCCGTYYSLPCRSTGRSRLEEGRSETPPGEHESTSVAATACPDARRARQVRVSSNRPRGVRRSWQADSLCGGSDGLTSLPPRWLDDSPCLARPGRVWPRLAIPYHAVLVERHFLAMSIAGGAFRG
jgi:hypothetical protein